MSVTRNDIYAAGLEIGGLLRDMRLDDSNAGRALKIMAIIRKLEEQALPPQRCLNCGAREGSSCQAWCGCKPGRPMPGAEEAQAHEKIAAWADEQVRRGR